MNEALQECPVHKFSHNAMATSFEVFIAGQDAEYARQAATACFTLLDRVEEALSRFVEFSDVSQINRLKPRQSVRVGPHAFECLSLAQRVSEATGGAFDVTIGPLMACWRKPDGSPKQPSDAELADARARVGMHLLTLDERELRVSTQVEGVRIDLGGIGKGYVLDQMVDLLEEWSIESALVQSGDSTALALAPPPGEAGWPVGYGGVGQGPSGSKVMLSHRALSGSGTFVQGKHIMDPRTGHPAQGHAAWALSPTAAVADALSTAFMVMPEDAVRKFCEQHSEVAAVILVGDEGQEKRITYGNWR